MGCKKIPQYLSYPLLLLGVVTIVMGITVTTGSSWMSSLMPADDSGDAEAEEFAADAASLGSAFEIGIYVFGVYMSIMALLGACVCGRGKCGRPGLLFFQIFQLVLIAVTLVIATIPAAFWGITDDQMDWFCANDSAGISAWFSSELRTDWYVDYVVEGRQYVADADATISQRDAVMCTRACPCDVDNWDLWKLVDSDFDTTGLETDEDGVDDWEECQDRLDAASGSSSSVTAVQTYFDGILELMEEDFNCQGICTPGRFWLFQEVEDGPVTEGCLTAMKERFAGKSLAAAIVLLITVVFDLMIWICMWQFCCKPYEKDD